MGLPSIYSPYKNLVCYSFKTLISEGAYLFLVKNFKKLLLQKIYQFYQFLPEFLMIFIAVFSAFYLKFTAVNCKNNCLTHLPTSGINFKNFVAVIFYHGEP
jgi:hypothetical protein